MGRDKGAIIYHGVDQVHHLASLLQPFVGDAYISIRSSQSTATHLQGMQCIVDAYTCESPLNGIVSAMDMKPDAAWLVVAVDMPNITREAIATLIDKRNPSKNATAYESPFKSGPDPLFAIWEPRVHERLKVRLMESKGTHVCPRATLQEMGAEILYGMVPPAILKNINVQEEENEWKEFVQIR